MRHRLPFVPGLLVVFATFARGDDKGKEGDKKWKEIELPDGLTVAMPGEPKEMDQAVGAIKLKLWIAESADKKGAYVFGTNKLPAAPAEKEIAAALEGAAKGQFGSMGGELKKTSPIKFADKHPGLECDGTVGKGAQGGIAKSRIFIIGDTMYQLLAVGEKDFVESKESKRFIESLKAKEKK